MVLLYYTDYPNECVVQFGVTQFHSYLTRLFKDILPNKSFMFRNV